MSSRANALKKRMSFTHHSPSDSSLLLNNIKRFRNDYEVRLVVFLRSHGQPPT